MNTDHARRTLTHLDRQAALAPSIALERPLTFDEAAGMAWWNALTPAARKNWLRLAGSAVAADAWELYKRDRAGSE